MSERGGEAEIDREVYCRGLDGLGFLSAGAPHDFCPEA